MSIKIKKATGKVEDFDESKLLNSLIRAGADKDHAEEVVKEVVSQIVPLMSTKKIFRLAHKYLRQYNRASVLRYSLKEALLRLGPSGYPFEKYIAKLLSNMGYNVQVGINLNGKCVDHEIDVFAENDNRIVLVECKYRNNSEGSHDVKTALYVHSRHQDLKPEIEKLYPEKQMEGWLVTNTRFTSDAIRFGECSGMILKSWKYPKEKSLEKIIEQDKLYPVTVLSGLNTKQIHVLIEQDIILMRDIAKMEAGAIKQLLLISYKRANEIRKEAQELCAC